MIAYQGSRGHRMVRLHTLKGLSPALTLIHYTDPLFYLHHAVWPLTHYLLKKALRFLRSITDG